MTTRNDAPSREAMERVAAVRVERQRLTCALDRLRPRLRRASALAANARKLYDAEQRDVDRLEGATVSRAWATLRGSRAADLDRERAEAQRARVDAERALATAARLQAEFDELARALIDLGDERDDAERALEELVASGQADADIMNRLDHLYDVRRTQEALAAGERARLALLAARRSIADADAWSTYDTWLDGGVIASTVKHHHLDDADALLRAAAGALEQFSRELAAVDLPAVHGPAIDQLARTIDVWFDHFFTDFDVQRRIKDVQAQTDAALDATVGALSLLEGRLTALQDEV